MVHILMRSGEESSGRTGKIGKMLKLDKKLYIQGDTIAQHCAAFNEVRAITGDTEFILTVKRIQH